MMNRNGEIMGHTILKLEDFSYVYPTMEDTVLKDINFEVHKGDFVGIIGRNKSGKSTLCTALVGLIPFVLGGKWQGNLYIKGEAINDRNVINITNTVGIVFQDAESQFSQESVEDEIAFAMCNLGIPKEDMLIRMKEVVASCNLTDLIDRSPYQLSGGQQQRLAVACMLALRPEVIIFDETTSQLDPIGRDEVFKIANEMHEQGYTIIMVDHNIEKLAQYSSHLAVLHNGELKLYGDTKEIIQKRDELKELSIRLPQVSEAAFQLKNSYHINHLPIDIEEAKEMLKEENRYV